MPSVCVVSNCKNKYSLSKNISYHKFPLKNQNILLQWIKFVNRAKGWKPTRWSSICCNHFKPTDFKQVSKERRRLKRVAVPSIYCCNDTEDSTLNNCVDSPNKEIAKDPKTKKLIIQNDDQISFRERVDKIQKEAIKEKIQDESYVLKEINCKIDKPDKCKLTNEPESPPPTTNSKCSPNCDIKKQESNNNEVSIEKDCRLCSNRCRTVATFLTNFELLGILQKCFPTLNFEQHDNMTKDVCSICLKRLKKFSGFVDDVIKSQKTLQEKYHIVKSNKPSSNPERSLKIKQEPIVNVKQEQSEYKTNELNHDLEMSMEFEDELDHKLDFYGLPNLNAQDIIDNCDIMEIINLDDGFIDIPDDEVLTDDSKNCPKFMEDFESIMRINNFETTNRNILEHNYCSTFGEENFQAYKTENNDDDEDFKIPPYFADDSLSTTENKFFDNCAVDETQIDNQPNTTLSSFSVQKMLSKYGKQSVSHDLQSISTKMITDNIKPNIVVLNESIVKTAEAGLHSCYFCQRQFLYQIELDNHLRENHSNPNVSTYSTVLRATDRLTYQKEASSRLNMCNQEYDRKEGKYNPKESKYNSKEKENDPKHDEVDPKIEENDSKKEECNSKKKENDSKEKDLNKIQSFGSSSATQTKNAIKISSIELNSNTEERLDISSLKSLEPLKPKKALPIILSSTISTTTFSFNSPSAAISSESSEIHSNAMIFMPNAVRSSTEKLKSPKDTYFQPYITNQEYNRKKGDNNANNEENYLKEVKDDSNKINSLKARSATQTKDAIKISSIEFNSNTNERLAIKSLKFVEPVKPKKALPIILSSTISTTKFPLNLSSSAISMESRENRLNVNASLDSSVQLPTEILKYPKNTSTQPYIANEVHNSNVEEYNPKDEEEINNINIFPTCLADPDENQDVSFLEPTNSKKASPIIINSTISTIALPFNSSNSRDSSKLSLLDSFPLKKVIQHSNKSPIISFVPITESSTSNSYQLSSNSIELGPAYLKREISCRICLLRFKTFRAYFEHKFKEHKNRTSNSKKWQTTCTKCQKVFTSKLAHKNHINYICDYKNNKHFLYGCKNCNIILSHWRLLKHHHLSCKMIQHNQLIKKKRTLNKVFSCKYCDKTYFRYQCFKKHELSHIRCVKKLKGVLKQNKHNELPETVLQCNICDKRFKNKYLLKTHIMRHNKTKLFCCTKCSKTFAGYNNLLQHQITHIDERKFNCNLCKKVFKRRSGLQQHIRGFHLKLKPHKCNVCQHQYALKADMMRCRHSDIHAYLIKLSDKN